MEELAVGNRQVVECCLPMVAELGSPMEELLPVIGGRQRQQPKTATTPVNTQNFEISTPVMARAP